MYCPNCGTANADTNRFCLKCGFTLPTGAVATPPLPQPSKPTAIPVAPVKRSKPPVALFALAGVIVVGVIVGAVVLLTNSSQSSASPIGGAGSSDVAVTKSPTATLRPSKTPTPRPTAIPTRKPTATPSPTPASLPDLIISGFRTDPAKPVQGSSYSEVYTIQNVGNAASAPAVIRITWNDGNATEFEAPPLEPGASTEIAQKVKAKDSIPASWRGDAVIDYYNVVQESDESNNTAVAEYTVAKAPVVSGPPINFAPGPLTIGFSENAKYCKDQGNYIIEFTIYANGGKPPYTYYRDLDRIGGPTNRGLNYKLIYAETGAAVGTFIVIDSAGQRAEIKFFSKALRC